MQKLGDFEILGELGRGGMGVVYEARQISLKRRVALKVLPPALGLSPQARQRFEREAQAAAKLHHTNIVPVHAIGEEDGHHFYAMDLIHGQSLDRVLSDLTGEGSNPLMETTIARAASELRPEKPAQTRDEGTTSLSDTSAGNREWFDTVAKLLADVADALHYAHGRGIVHRDVKPANLMLAAEGHLCLTDFGLARLLQEPGMTVSGSFLGTPAYMSPEQIAAGRVQVDHRTDIYSLGAVLYEMLTLQRPFGGESREHVLSAVLTKDPRPPRRFNGKIPLDLETICLKALEKDPDRRYATAGEMAQDLRQYLHGGLIAARRAGAARRMWKSIRRHPAVSISVAAGILVAALGMWVWQASSVGRVESLARIVADARYAYEEGRDRAALALVDRVLAQDPDHVEARLLRANVLSSLDKGKAAAKEAEAILADHPDDWRAHLALVLAVKQAGGGPIVRDIEGHVRAVEELAPGTADAYFARALVTEDGEERLKLLDQTLERDPGHVAALVNRLHTQKDWFRDWDAAVADAERLIVARPRSVQGRRVKARALRAKQDYAAALAAIDEAIELDPEEPRNFEVRAFIYWSTGRQEESLKEIGRSIELDPRSFPYRWRSERYRILGRYDAAIADARKALELDPDDRWAYYALLDVYQNFDRPDDFQATVDELRSQTEHWDLEAQAAVHQRLSGYYRRAGNLRDALEDAARAVELDPDSVWAHDARIGAQRALNDEAGFAAACDALAALELKVPKALWDRAKQLGWACLRWEQAVAHLDRVIEKYPTWAEPYVDRGTAHYFLKHYRDSLTDLTRAIELNPYYAGAYNNRAVVFSVLRRYEDEIADLEKSLELNPRNSRALNNRAAAHERLGRLERAVADLDRAIDADPFDPWPYKVRAVVKNQLGRFEEAVADARRSIELDSTDPDAYGHLIDSYRGLGDETRARATADELRAAAGQWVDGERAARGFGDASVNYRQLGEHEAALEAAGRGVEKDPTNHWTFLVRARAHRAMGEARSYRADCDAAAAIELEDAALRVDRAQGVALHCNRWNWAVSELDRVLDDNPDDRQALWFRAWFKRFLGASDEALAGFDEVVRVDSRHPSGYVARAWVQAIRGRCDAALEDIQRARELVPERMDTWAEEAWIHAAVLFHTCPDRYDTDAAHEPAQKAAAVNPRNLDFQIAAGMTHYRKGRFEQAHAALEKALALDTEPVNEPLRLFPLAMTQRKLGRHREADATYDRALALMQETAPRYPLFSLLQQEAATVLGR